MVTTDDFTKSVDALVYEIDEGKELTKIAYPIELFDRNIVDGRAMIASFLTLTIGNNQGMGDVEYAKMYDFYMPPALLRLFDGPSATIKDLWRVLGRPVVDGGFIVGTIIKPKLGLRPQPFAKACYDFWLDGDFIKNDEPQGNQVFSPFKETVAAVRDAMVEAQNKTGQAKLFSFNITADDYREIIARGEYILRPSARTPTTSLSSWTVMLQAPLRSPRRGAISPSSTCTITARATAPSPRRIRSAATPPSCSAKWRGCKARRASTPAPWASARWRAIRKTASSPAC